MPLYNSAWLLARFKAEAGLQAANEMDDTTDLYPRLSAAQADVYADIAAIDAKCLYSAPFTLTASADRKTFTFGSDSAGNAILPKGWVQISPRQNGFSGDTFVGWVEGRDFLDEGDRIRVVSNCAYSGTLYCRAVLTPPDITAAVPPTLNPPDARDLIAIRAVMDWAGEGNQNAKLAQTMAGKWAAKFPRLMLTLRTRYRGGGGQMDPALWYLSTDLGRG